jgi:RNA polymerase sigma-70 factor, ECF subfamily
MEFCAFDTAYLERLRSGDLRTEQHFAAYFGALIQIKLRSRNRSPEDIEDIRQETFIRVFKALRSDGGIREPEKLGPFVNSVCNHVRNEFYRVNQRAGSVEDETAAMDYPDPRPDALHQVIALDRRGLVREVVDELPERDRRILRAVILEDRDKDDVCREEGINREYLRVLQHRALILFKKKYLEATSEPRVQKRTASVKAQTSKA